MSSVYEKNFKLLEKVFGKDWFKISQVKLKREPFMDLHFEKLQENHFAMAHYYKQNGDLVADPDMEIFVDPQEKWVEALSYQDYRSYRKVYPDFPLRNRFYVSARSHLNQFLGFWLRNLVKQGFKNKK